MDSLLSWLTSIAAGVGILLLFYHKRQRGVERLKTAPKAPGAWPLIGHLPMLGGAEPSHKTLGAMADKLGPIFTLRLGLQSALVVSSWEMAKECFTTNDADVSSRPSFLARDHLGYNGAMFGFAPYGPYWREMRKIAVVELLSNHRLQLLKHIRVSEVKTSLTELYQFWKENRTHSCQALVELSKWLGDLALNVLIRMIAGKRYNINSVNSRGAPLEKEARRCQKAVRELFDLLGVFVVSDFIPHIEWLDLGGHGKAMKRTAKDLDEIVGGWLEEHKSNRASGEYEGDQDFMGALLSKLGDADYAGYDVETVIKATCLSMLAGGTDTTIVTLTWAISLLLNNPHTLKKAQEELDARIGKERLVNISDIGDLLYLQAVVKETLRLYPAAPLPGPRVFTKDCVVGGYHVPKGTRLFPNIWKIQTDPRVWIDPLEFKPERYFTSQKNVDVKGNNFELIPFGSGRRMCPGMSLGLQMVHFTLASLLQAFEISKPSDKPIDMTESFGMTNLKATPLQIFVAPRLSANLLEE